MKNNNLLLCLILFLFLFSCSNNNSNQAGQDAKTNESTTTKSSDNSNNSRMNQETDLRPRVYSCAFDGTNIREQPASKSQVLGQFRNGPSGAVYLGENGDWSYINCNGITGYVLSKYINSSPTDTVTISGDISWLYGNWVESYPLLYGIYDNGEYFIYSDSMNEGMIFEVGTFLLKGNQMILRSNKYFDVDLIKWLEKERTTVFTLDEKNKTIGDLKKKPFEPFNNEEYAYEGDLMSYMLTKKGFDENRPSKNKF